MKPLIAQLGKLVLVLALCHGALVGTSLWLYPMKARVDTIAHGESLFRDPFDAAVHGALESGFRDGDPLVIVGPSNAILAFRPEEVEPLIPGARVHNLATASMRADEMRQLVQVAWTAMSPGQRGRATFVACLIFTSFPSPDSIYVKRQAGIEHAIRASGAVRDVDGDVVPRWTAVPRQVVMLMGRPLVLIDAWRDDVSRYTWGVRTVLAEALRGGSFDLAALGRTRSPDPLVFPHADTAAGRQANLSLLRYLVTGKGTDLGTEQFAEIRRLVGWATEHDVHLVLVGMPVPDWVRSALPYFADYRRQIDPILRDVGEASSVRFVDLYDAPLPLWDATHPDPSMSAVWAERLATALRVH